jgi:predicted metalloprotease with PDZ domain
MRTIPLLFTAAVLGAAAWARTSPDGAEGRERPASTNAPISYRVRIDEADLATVDVEVRPGGGSGTLRLAMATHPEYDDRSWRGVEELRVDGDASGSGVTRLDSALWLIRAGGDHPVIHYRIRLSAPVQGRLFARRPYLSPRGGLIGGVQTFLYVVGRELSPCSVTLDIPPGWKAATGLERTADPLTFTAPGAATLVDAPILLGDLRIWRFDVDGIPHRVAYLPESGAVPFDTAALVQGFARLVGETLKLFGRLPYHEYAFLLRDGALGALEHLNSLIVGFSSGEFARDPRPLFATIAHEYFHTWNLLRLRPAEFGPLRYGPPPRSRGLWWSEGVTMLYADLLLRRAGLPVYSASREAHIQELIGRYVATSGNARFSPEDVSLHAFDSTPGGLGDYSASTHLQGELLGTMIDLKIRDATNGKRSMDDLMRAMYNHFSGERGFTGDDVEKTASLVCGCGMHALFESFVRTARGIDFNTALGLIGLRVHLVWEAARDTSGEPEPDTRVFAWQAPWDSLPSLGITDPESCWGKAGLHTGDTIIRVNGTPVSSAADFRGYVSRLHPGDTLWIDLRRGGTPVRAGVSVTGYNRPSVVLEEIPGATGKQRTLRSLWETSAP